MGSCAWRVVHGELCMGRFVWGDLYGEICMGSFRWGIAHMSCAWGVVHGELCMGRFVWGGLHGELNMGNLETNLVRYINLDTSRIARKHTSSTCGIHVQYHPVTPPDTCIGYDSSLLRTIPA